MADAVAMLDDPTSSVRLEALRTLGELDPSVVAEYAGVVVARLEDPDLSVCERALETLGKLEPAMLAPHGGAVAAMLHDPHFLVVGAALETLPKLDPARLAQHAGSLVAMLKNPKMISSIRVACKTLPRVIIQDMSYFHGDEIYPLLLRRLAWYKCRLRLRARLIALYWYTLPYRPGGAGHARDVEAWGRMKETHGNTETARAKQRPVLKRKAAALPPRKMRERHRSMVEEEDMLFVRTATRPCLCLSL